MAGVAGAMLRGLHLAGSVTAGAASTQGASGAELSLPAPAPHWQPAPVPTASGRPASHCAAGHCCGRRRTRKGRSLHATSQNVGDVENEDEDEHYGRHGLVPEALGVTASGRYSISDDDFAGQGLEFSTSRASIDLDQLNSLFARVGFPKREHSKLRRALTHTSSVIWLRNMKSGKLLAFARATGDGVFNATIWDVVVDPSYQGTGLGKAVMERLMAELRSQGISNITLYAEPNVVSFYKPLGFIPDPSGISGMAYDKRRAASLRR